MKSKAQPNPAVALTEEEKLRDDRVLDRLEKAIGGYSIMTVANLSHCSEVQARASLNRLVEQGKIELRDSYGKSKLYGIKREKTSSSWGLRAGS